MTKQTNKQKRIQTTTVSVLQGKWGWETQAIQRKYSPIYHVVKKTTLKRHACTKDICLFEMARDGLGATAKLLHGLVTPPRTLKLGGKYLRVDFAFFLRRNLTKPAWFPGLYLSH